MNELVRLRLYQSQDWAQVQKLSVTSAQAKYVASIEQLFSKPKVHWRFHVIEVNRKIVGFFNVDTKYWIEFDYAVHGELGIRSFFIDQHHQGQGYATSAARQLVDFCFESYPACQSLCLTVNCKNTAAYRVYKSVGFKDTETHYLGGKAGPQHIMRATRPH